MNPHAKISPGHPDQIAQIAELIFRVGSSIRRDDDLASASQQLKDAEILDVASIEEVDMPAALV